MQSYLQLVCKLGITSRCLLMWIHLSVPGNHYEGSKHNLSFNRTNCCHDWSRVHLWKTKRECEQKKIFLFSWGFICWFINAFIQLLFWSVVAVDFIIVQYLYPSIYPVHCRQNLTFFLCVLSKSQDNVSLTSKIWIINFL